MVACVGREDSAFASALRLIWSPERSSFVRGLQLGRAGWTPIGKSAIERHWMGGLHGWSRFFLFYTVASSSAGLYFEHYRSCGLAEPAKRLALEPLLLGHASCLVRL